MLLGVENPSLDLIEKACVKARNHNFTTISDYVTFLIEQDANIEEQLTEDQIYTIINDLIDLAIANRRELRVFTMQELYTFCVKKEDDFEYPKWSNLSRSARIELGKKFKAAILKHADKIEKGDYYLRQDGANINNSALYCIDRDRSRINIPL